jgi:hypothetical protein
VPAMRLGRLRRDPRKAPRRKLVPDALLSLLRVLGDVQPAACVSQQRKLVRDPDALGGAHKRYPTGGEET